MPVKLLVVEDEKSILKLLRTILTANKYEVVEASTGAEALSLITSHCPDLILLDLGLPDMDGNTLLSSVRKWTSTPVIVLSPEPTNRTRWRLSIWGRMTTSPSPSAPPSCWRVSAWP